MGTRLDQLQAAAKAKTAVGQPIFSQQVNAPQVTPQATAVSVPTGNKTTQPVSSPKVATAVASPSNTAMKSPTPSVGALAGLMQSVPTAVTTPNAAPKTTVSTAGQSPTAAVAQPNTNYVQQGGQTLNNLLYLKKSYESGKTGAAAYAGQYYNQLDPNTAAAVKNMNAAQLEQYITGRGNASATNGQAAQQGTPAVATKDYNALAQAQYDRELAAMLAGAQSQETELNRRYDYANGVTQDNRQLETATFNRNNAPIAWDGSTGYQAAQMDRNRGIEDHYTGEALKDNVAAAYSQANAFRGQAGNYLTTAANQLQTADQQLAMQEAGLTGQYKGQQTMQGAANAAQLTGQNIANQIAKIDLSTYPQQSALKLQQLQQQVQSGQISNDAAAYQLTQLTDPNSASNKAASLELEMKSIDASNYPEEARLKLEQLRKTVAEIGKVPYQSETDKQLDQLKVEQAKLELQKIKEGETAETKPEKTYEDYQSAIEKIADRDSKTGVLKNPDSVKQYISDSPLSSYEKYRAWVASGLTWPSNVAVPTPGE